MIDFKHYDLKLTKYIKGLWYLCLNLIKKLDSGSYLYIFNTSIGILFGFMHEGELK